MCGGSQELCWALISGTLGGSQLVYSSSEDSGGAWLVLGGCWLGSLVFGDSWELLGSSWQCRRGEGPLIVNFCTLDLVNSMQCLQMLGQLMLNSFPLSLLPLTRLHYPRRDPSSSLEEEGCPCVQGADPHTLTSPSLSLPRRLMEAGRMPPPPHPSLPPQKARAAFTPIPPTDLPAPHPGRLHAPPAGLAVTAEVPSSPPTRVDVAQQTV